MVAAGLIENSERARVTWERDVEERFFAYKGAYETFIDEKISRSVV